MKTEVKGGKKEQQSQSQDKNRDQDAGPAQEQPSFSRAVGNVYSVVQMLEKIGYAGFITMAADKFVLTINRLLTEEQSKLQPQQQQALLLSIDANAIGAVIQQRWIFDGCYIHSGINVAEFHRFYADVSLA